MTDQSYIVCCIGKLCQEKCNCTFLNTQNLPHKVIDLSENDFNILANRIVGFKKNEDEVICDFH